MKIFIVRNDLKNVTYYCNVANWKEGCVAKSNGMSNLAQLVNEKSDTRY